MKTELKTPETIREYWRTYKRQYREKKKALEAQLQNSTSKAQDSTQRGESGNE
jgi:hypothetical protein